VDPQGTQSWCEHWNRDNPASRKTGLCLHKSPGGVDRSEPPAHDGRMSRRWFPVLQTTLKIVQHMRMAMGCTGFFTHRGVIIPGGAPPGSGGSRRRRCLSPGSLAALRNVVGTLPDWRILATLRAGLEVLAEGIRLFAQSHRDRPILSSPASPAALGHVDCSLAVCRGKVLVACAHGGEQG